ncbi:RTA1 like protein-domain-containing protein [Lophiotrema nucula]|uniref:RTA1 like protein-domain-containing protein n=1 Tax=Lophiotrema nucula TaxID=690887 RepID=A0A6A5ZDD6_9PLEO|nr:RTA1 like protein-domain-containing protein [Lophiotrema nucula]
MPTSTTSLPSSASTTTATPTCTTAVPGKYGYVPPEACNANWSYNPSFSAAIAFTTLFGLLTLAQITLAFIYRKGFCWVMIMGVLWETLSFIFRALGAHHQQSTPYAFAANLLFLLAPLWINAFAYMTAGRLIWMFHPAKRVLKVKAMSIGKYFVWLDIFSFIVQGIGGTMLSPGASASTMKTGKNVYMTGVGVQQLFILLFIGLIVKFHVEVNQLERNGVVNHAGKRWRWLTYALYAALVLITIRIIYRLVEFSAGTDVSNPLPYHEGYALGLDAVPMFLAISILTIIHPGTVLKGPESEFPSRKERRAEKKAIKAAKKEAKAAKKNGFVGKDIAYSPAYTPAAQSSNEQLMQGMPRDVELGYLAPHPGEQQQSGVARY